jgi:hypothetical protein
MKWDKVAGALFCVGCSGGWIPHLFRTCNSQVVVNMVFYVAAASPDSPSRAQRREYARLGQTFFALTISM